MIHPIVFKRPEIGTCTVNVKFEFFILFPVVLNKVLLVGLAKDCFMKICAEIIDAEKKLGSGIICERRRKFRKFDLARPKLFVNRVL